MSGSWRERVEARRFLKPDDVATALRDLNAAIERQGAVLGDHCATCGTSDDLREQLAEFAARIAKLEAPSSAARPATKAAAAKADSATP